MPRVAARQTAQQPAQPLQLNFPRHFDPTPGEWLSEEAVGLAGLDENLRRYVAITR